MDKALKQLIERANAETLQRMASIQATRASEAEDYKFTLSFSSEEPYERFFGIEILGHEPNEVDLKWLQSGTAPLLVDHDRTQPVGVIEKAWIEGGRGKAVVRFGKSARAQEIRQDVIDGIRTNVSVGYMVHEMTLQKKGKENTPDEYRVTRWEPLESSLVSIPADKTVGVGRSKIGQPADEVKPTIEVKEHKMPDIDLKKNSEDTLKAERSRIAEIVDLGKKHKMTAEAEKAVAEGATVEDFRRTVLDVVAARAPQVDAVVAGLSRKEKRDLSRFSFLKAIREKVDGTLSGLELEMHQEAIREGRSNSLGISGLGIPACVLGLRDLTVTTEGTDVVQTAIQSGSFIELLRNKMVVKNLGATMLTGLVGNVQLPRISGGASAFWEGENDAGDEETQTIDNVSLTPNRVGCYTEVSKQFLNQVSFDAEAMIRNDLATAIALAIDYAAINGAGENDEPTGILNQSGIGSVVAGNPDGGYLTWADIVQLETEVAQDNADVGALAYLTNAKVRGILKRTEKAANTAQFIWTDTLNGYRAEVSNQVPSNGTKGGGSALSAILFGNWRDLIIAQWAGLDVVVDPYSLATTALVRITVNSWADCDVRHVQSFAACEDAVTL